MKIQKKTNKIFYKIMPAYLTSMALSLLLLSGAAKVAAAEYVYISDHLRVGVRTEPLSGVPPISVVFTGMRLEVLDRSDGYVKISTDKGISGWIKDIYVTNKAPAIIQLNQVQIKYDALQKEFVKVSEAAAVLEKANKVSSEQVDELKAEQREWSIERANLVASKQEDSSWLWVVEIILLMLLSFAVGVYWYKTHVAKRLGGLRV